jgi:beta-glucosidase
MEKRKHPGFVPKKPHKHEPYPFPKGFLWGAATSSHQVEGWNDKNDWWEWEHQQGTIADGQMSGRGPDHYHRYEQDFDFLEEMNLNAYRMSIEWSRINPEKGKFDANEIDHYIKVLKSLKARGIKVMLTLHHFTLPAWFADMGGFEKRGNVQYFLNYVEKVVPLFRPYVDFWITINEPNIYTMMSYLFGNWPPGKKSKWAAYKVYDNLARAHKEAYRIIHSFDDERTIPVGIAHNVTSFYVYNRRSLIDWAAVNIVDWVWNHWFLEKTKGYHDFLGINYYVHKRIKGIKMENLAVLLQDNQGEGRERTDLDWEIFAPGFFDGLMGMKEHKLPIYITENGISTLNDHQRARYLISYLKELYHAIKGGVDVRGYFHWSLLDNFEWDKGYKSRFGLVEVNYGTLERRLRGSGKLYGRIAKMNKIEHVLMRFIGHAVSPEDVLEKLEGHDH